MNTLAPEQYKYNENLSEIQLNASIQVIPRGCFQSCKNLRKITIPRSVKIIGYKAFMFSGLEEVIFEEGSNLCVLSAHSFESCSFLTTINLPPTVRIIGDYCFKNCRNLGDKISIPANTWTIGAFAFANCRINQLEFTIPSLSSKTINMKGKLMTLSIGEGAFKQCFNLQSLNIPPHINFIGVGAFAYSGLENVEFGIRTHTNNLISSTPTLSWTSISNEMFQQCRRLTSISIPPFIESIGKRAFAGSGIEKVEFWENSLETNTSTNAVNAANAATGRRLLRLGRYSFSHCQSLKSICIPSFVRFINSNAFGTSTLEEIIFSQDLKLVSIPDDTFIGCQKLKSVALPPSIFSIGKRAFTASGITTPTFSRIFAHCQIKYIREGAFSGCKNLTQYITIPSTVRSIGKSAFAYSTIESIIFSQDSQLKMIPNWSFAHCYQLETVVFPPTIVSIGEYAFFKSKIDTQSIDTIFKNCKIENIDRKAFSNCKNITQTLFIPSSVRSIGVSAFSESNIKNIIFSQDSQIKAIPDNMFSFCENLISVRLPPSVISIGKSAFFGTNIDNESLVSILTNNIQDIGNCAFANCKNLQLNLIPPSILNRLPADLTFIFGSDSIYI